jgi:hypothetical protein
MTTEDIIIQIFDEVDNADTVSSCPSAASYVIVRIR